MGGGRVGGWAGANQCRWVQATTRAGCHQLQPGASLPAPGAGWPIRQGLSERAGNQAGLARRRQQQQEQQQLTRSPGARTPSRHLNLFTPREARRSAEAGQSLPREPPSFTHPARRPLAFCASTQVAGPPPPPAGTPEQSPLWRRAGGGEGGLAGAVACASCARYSWRSCLPERGRKEPPLRRTLLRCRYPPSLHCPPLFPHCQSHTSTGPAHLPSASRG